MSQETDPPVQPDDGPDETVLNALADEGEVAVDTTPGDAHAASNGVDVATPAGRLAFEVYPVEDTGADHERHDPDAGVYVDRWYYESYTILHVHEVDAEPRIEVADPDAVDGRHTVLVREKNPQERAEQLRRHGVPERRAQVVALRERGLTYSEICEWTGEAGPNNRGDVSRHLQRFDEQLADAKWLAENAEPVAGDR